MSLNTQYEDSNVFAKIIRGELPCTKVYEDEHTLAFMDAFPHTPGHVLVIDKTVPAVNLIAMSDEALSRTIKVVRKVAAAVVKALEPEGFRVVQFNGEAAGQTVFHTHFHIIPAWTGATEAPHAANPGDSEALADLAERIRHAL